MMSELFECTYCGMKLPSPGVHHDYVDCFDFVKSERDALRSELSQLREQVRWIPVSEKLPENDSIEVWDMCLCKINWYGEIKVAALYFIGGSWYGNPNYVRHNYDKMVIEWMPLPQPPKEKA